MSLFQIIGNFFSDKVKVPLDNDGNVSLKLTDLSKENKISIENAHDAIVDCMLMLNLMKIIKSRAPEALEAAVRGSSKNGNIELSKSLPFTLLGEIYRKKKYIYPVIACGQNPNQTNQVALIDLYFDPIKMFEMSDYELSEQFGSGGGIKTISINKSIPLIPADNIPNIELFLDSPKKILESRAKLVLENTDFQDRICELLSINQREYPPNKFIEQKVYERFPSNSDKLWMERFEISPWSEKSKLLNGFEDERFRLLSQRLINYLKPEFSSNKDKDNYHEFLRERLLVNGPWKMNLEKAISRTNTLKVDAEESNNAENLKIIESLLIHYQEKLALSEL
jgi:exodeoxyribonuclease-1